MPQVRRLRPSASRVIGVLGALGALLVLAAAGLLLAREHRALYEQQAERQALMARVLEDHASRSFDAALLALASIAEPAAHGLPAEMLQALLVQTQASLPTLRGVALLDEHGRVLAAADPSDRGQQIAPARLGLQAGAGDQLGGFIAARSLAGLAPGAVAAPPGVGFVPLARPWVVGGVQRGWLVALLNPDAFANFQQMTLADADSAAALLRLDGEVLAATAESGLQPGQTLPPFEALQRVTAGSELGGWQGRGLRAGEQAAVYRALRHRPLLVVVETPTKALDARWWQRARDTALLAALTALALLMLARAAAASLRSRERTRTALTSARQRVAESEQELRAQLGLARSLLASNPLPMSVLDRDNHYLDVNPAWEQFTGRHRDQVLGTRAASYLPPEEAALHDARDAELLERGGEARYEALWHDADGHTRDLFISKSTFPGPDGRPAGIVVSFMDISEFREAERTTRAARDAALQASQAKSEFIANVSHELRTPLQSILGFSELGQLRAREHPRLAEMFGDVHRAGTRMLALVNDLLDLAKIEQHQEQIHPERQDLRPLLSETAAELRPLLAAKRLDFSLELPEEDLVALVDAPRLQQVLRNLLANAIKFSPEGAPLALSASLEGNLIRVDVADRGPGIPEAEMEQIFEAFVQSSATKDGSGGTGLGLAICRRLVAAHGGRLRAANRPGGGAVFSVWLPATRFGDTTPLSL